MRKTRNSIVHVRHDWGHDVHKMKNIRAKWVQNRLGSKGSAQCWDTPIQVCDRRLQMAVATRMTSSCPKGKESQLMNLKIPCPI